MNVITYYAMLVHPLKIR